MDAQLNMSGNNISDFNIVTQSNFSIYMNDFSYVNYWMGDDVLQLYELSNGNFVYDFTPSGTASFLFRYKGANKFSFGSSGTIFNDDFIFTQGLADAKIYQSTRASDAATNDMIIEAQKAYSSCTGSNCDGGDLYISGGQSVDAGINGSLYILSGGEDKGGNVVLQINDTGTQSHMNITLVNEDCFKWANGGSICHNGSRIRISP